MVTYKTPYQTAGQAVRAIGAASDETFLDVQRHATDYITSQMRILEEAQQSQSRDMPRARRAHKNLMAVSEALNQASLRQSAIVR